MPRARPRTGRTTPADDPRSWPVQRTSSYGGVVSRTSDEGHEVALIRVRREGGEVWTLPKGMAEEGESPVEAALREVREETGLVAEVVAPLEPITYWFSWAPDRVRYRKTVHLFLMRATGGDIADHDDEVESVAFFGLVEAAAAVAYPSERAAIVAASAAIGAA